MGNLISEIIFYDVYRTLILNIISILIIYFGVNYHKEKYYVFYLAFLVLLILPFVFIILTGIVFTNFDKEIMEALFIWSFKWIAYFVATFIVQHIIIVHIKKLRKISKLSVCILLFIISLNISLMIVLPHLSL